MKINLNNPTEEVQIQIIPLIDVVFCILVFFILASLQFTRQQSINIDLPQANTATSSVLPDTQREILPVTIDAVGQIYVEKNPVQREQLGSILGDYLNKNPKGTLVLYASRSATYNDVIEILDLLRQVGGDRVSLAIIPGSEEQPANPNLNPLQPIPNSPLPGINPDGTITLPNSPLSPNLPQNNPNLNLPPGSTQIPLPSIPNQPQTEQGVPPRNPSSGNPATTIPPASAPTQPAAPQSTAPAAPAQTNPSP
ncbi:MAG: biopolymer transporter ExbD [Cyanobacteriota bacterium]|nr:biopolymer transporter ExbD [Cyanobacteriota bacterium]